MPSLGAAHVGGNWLGGKRPGSCPDFGTSKWTPGTIDATCGVVGSRDAAGRAALDAEHAAPASMRMAHAPARRPTMAVGTYTDALSFPRPICRSACSPGDDAIRQS
jgi:hypothetical protein